MSKIERVSGSRREFLVTSGIVAAALVLAGMVAPPVHAAENKGVLKETRDSTGSVAISWISLSGPEVRIHSPKLLADAPDSDAKQPIKLAITSQSVNQRAAVLTCSTALDVDGTANNGSCGVKVTLPDGPRADLLICDVQFKFDRPVRSDVTVQYVIDVDGKLASKMLLPEMTGFIKSHAVTADQAGQGHYLLGRDSASGGPRLALPAVNVEFDKSLAIATDPYFGAGFRTEWIDDDKGKHSRITISCTYRGSKVPVTSEKRTIALQFHADGPDGMLSNYYHTVPDIKPGAAWIHDIHLNYYDYLAEDGQGWFTHLKKLSEVIPKEYRKHVVVNLHGWYDYLGRYCYNKATGKLDDTWNAFSKTDLQHELSIADMHKRIRFAKDLGFRLALYFADGTSSDSGLPEYNKDWEAKDENGRPIKCWMGPGVIAQTYAMDPSHTEVQQWFLDRTEALLEEFGKEIDALVWDETFQFPAGMLTKVKTEYAYADRGMMVLTARLTRLIQSWHDRNPDLVFLTSDVLGLVGPAHTSLVAHGTYQDSHCNPKAWPPGMLINYRNCLISCNWSPIRNDERNRIAAEEYGIAQGLSDGYRDNKGPAEMDKALLDQVLERFFKNFKSKRLRTKYLIDSR